MKLKKSEIQAIARQIFRAAKEQQEQDIAYLKISTGLEAAVQSDLTHLRALSLLMQDNLRVEIGEKWVRRLHTDELAENLDSKIKSIHVLEDEVEILAISHTSVADIIAQISPLEKK